MKLNEYQVKPDEGLFDRVARRLMLRRLARIGGGVLAAAAVATAAWWLLTPNPSAPEAAAPTASLEVATAAEPVAQTPTTEPLDRTAGTPAVTAAAPQSAPAPARPSIAEAQPLLPATTAAPSQTAPELPRSGVASTDTPFAELILESATGAGAAPAVQPKADEPTTPATPHYDNLLLAPTVIVPAADNEENRRFKVLAAEEVSDFRMAIFNRAGRQVFSTQSIDQAWDATHDGTLVPQGAYVWVARYRDSEGHPRTEKGTVVVVR